MNRFLIKANIRHNGFYDYSKTVYVDAHTKIKIICPLHGEFLQRPANHLQGQGCTNCGLNKRHKKKDFIKEAKEKWGSIYDYTLTNYINKENKIDYTCLQHGLINQKPYLHIKHGCPFCNGRGVAKHTTETFIKEAIKQHGNTYDYNKTHFSSMSKKVIITCKTHGDFEQKAGNHIHLKNGCPQCKSNSIRKDSFTKQMKNTKINLIIL